MGEGRVSYLSCARTKILCTHLVNVLLMESSEDPKIISSCISPCDELHVKAPSISSWAPVEIRFQVPQILLSR
jgi:hypothetical protein